MIVYIFILVAIQQVFVVLQLRWPSTALCVGAQSIGQGACSEGEEAVPEGVSCKGELEQGERRQ